MRKTKSWVAHGTTHCERLGGPYLLQRLNWKTSVRYSKTSMNNTQFKIVARHKEIRRLWNIQRCDLLNSDHFLTNADLKTQWNTGHRVKLMRQLRGKTYHKYIYTSTSTLWAARVIYRSHLVTGRPNLCSTAVKPCQWKGPQVARQIGRFVNLNTYIYIYIYISDTNLNGVNAGIFCVCELKANIMIFIICTLLIGHLVISDQAIHFKTSVKWTASAHEIDV